MQRQRAVKWKLTMRMWLMHIVHPVCGLWTSSHQNRVQHNHWFPHRHFNSSFFISLHSVVVLKKILFRFFMWCWITWLASVFMIFLVLMWQIDFYGNNDFENKYYQQNKFLVLGLSLFYPWPLAKKMYCIVLIYKLLWTFTY